MLRLGRMCYASGNTFAAVRHVQRQIMQPESRPKQRPAGPAEIVVFVLPAVAKQSETILNGLVRAKLQLS